MEPDIKINQTKVDILGSLPPEIVQSISLYFTPADLENVSTCKKLWNQLLNRNYYWYKKCQVRGYNELKDTSISAIYEKYLVRFPFYWQLLFNYNQLQYNWTNDIFETTSVAGKYFIELVYFDDEILIATNIFHSNIFIVDSCTGQIKNTICRPEFSILKTVKYQNLLVIVMRSKPHESPYLQVLTMEDKLIFSKKLNDLSITSLHLFTFRLKVYKTLIAITDMTGFFHIIDFGKNTISYKNVNVCSVCFGDEVIALGKTNGTIEILDMSYITLRTINHVVRSKINKIMISQDYMIAFAESLRFNLDYYHDACVWSLKENVLLYIINEISISHGRLACSVYQDKLIFTKNYIHGGNYKLVVLDLSTGKQIFDITTAWRWVKLSLFNGNYMFVITSSRDSIGCIASIHCSQSGKKITSINDIYDDCMTLSYCGYHALRSTETKLAYVTNEGELMIRNYEKYIH